MSGFKKAERKQAKLKIGLSGPSGSGKTYSALLLAKGIGGKIAVIDTENSSAALYADEFDFDTLELTPPFTTEKYTNAMRLAEKEGYNVTIIDSASHQWAGDGGILGRKEQIDSRGGNSFTNWAKFTPEHTKFLQAIVQHSTHLICTVRSKQDYSIQQNDKGKSVPQKIGLAPVQREGFEYELTLMLDVAMDHTAQASKDRTGLFDKELFKVTEDTGKTIMAWLSSAKEVPNWKYGEEQFSQLKKLCEAAKWDGKKMRSECKTMHNGRIESELSELEFTKFCHSIALNTVLEAQKDLDQSSAAVIAKAAEMTSQMVKKIEVSPEFEAACNEIDI